MNTHKKINYKLILFCSLVIMASFAVLLPAVANADSTQWPGVDECGFSGTTAQTQINLKTDESKLSFTAPTVINFAMNGDGQFLTPESGVAHIKNNSLMKIKVVSYSVTSKNGSQGVSNIEGQTSTDKYQINIKGNKESILPFAISAEPNWVLDTKDLSGAICGLSFSDGRMLNPTGFIWQTGAELQEVIWTISSNI